MTRTVHRIAPFACVASAALLTAVPALAAPQPVQAWSAMQNTDVATLLRDIQSLPLSEMSAEDQPYCASDAEIAMTLDHDFGEHRVEADGQTELWGSDQMGTWTLVATRTDDTSCIIASGIGYTDGRAAEVFYQTAGL